MPGPNEIAIPGDLGALQAQLEREAFSLACGGSHGPDLGDILDHGRPLAEVNPEQAAIAERTIKAVLRADEDLRKAQYVPPTDNQSKDTNPKDSIGETKLPLYLVPATAIAMFSLAHLNGALKYGAWNWRVAGIRLSIYLNALRRHLSRFENGEWVDPDDGVPHLAAMGACLCIIIDALACGKLTDDRPPRSPIGKWFDDLTKVVKHLRELHKARKPRHWGLADSEWCSCSKKYTDTNHVFGPLCSAPPPP